MNNWNQSTESERVAELQHRCPDLARLLAKLEFSELPWAVRKAVSPPPKHTYRGSFYECLSERDEIIRDGGSAGQIEGFTPFHYFDWSLANG